LQTFKNISRSERTFINGGMTDLPIGVMSVPNQLDPRNFLLVVEFIQMLKKQNRIWTWKGGTGISYA